MGMCQDTILSHGACADQKISRQITVSYCLLLFQDCCGTPLARFQLFYADRLGLDVNRCHGMDLRWGSENF